MINNPKPYYINTLIILHNNKNQLLLIKRNKFPNLNCWSPIGGKLETQYGESPHECAVREILEEANFSVEAKDLNLLSIITQCNYQNNRHCLIFLFVCRKPLLQIPLHTTEGKLKFFNASELKNLSLPSGDKKLIWDTYYSYQKKFSILKVKYQIAKPAKITIEEII